MSYGPSKALQTLPQFEDFVSAERAAPCVTCVRFGPDFDVRDKHLQTIAEVVGPRLRSLYLGSSDTGNGTWVTDAGVLAVVQRCPSLQELALCSCTSVTDKAFAAVVEGLPNLEVLHCTGHDKSSGKLTAKALQPLLKGGLPNLRELYVTDQWKVTFEKVQQLLRKRKKLRVQAGETDSDSAAWGCVLAASGGSYGDGLYGRW